MTIEQEVEDYSAKFMISFIAIWDEELGPNVIDLYPKSSIGDIESLTIQIFQVYQFFYDSEQKFQRTNFVIPVKKLNKKAKVLFDTIPNKQVRGGFQPFIVVLLVPDYFTDDELNSYNQVMLKIAQEFLQNQNLLLKELHQNILDVFALSERIDDEELKVEEFYSYTAAMEDFQAGIRLFQSKNFDQAYQLLRKVLAKFKQEEHKHLILEVLYIFGSIFTQERKFKAAHDNFQKLVEIAEELNHKKYWELGTFMMGFSSFKIENFSGALKNFEKISIDESEFVNKLQYHTIYGRVLGELKKYEEALQQLLKALIITTGMPPNELVKRQQAQLLYELGVMNYTIAVETLNNYGLSQKEKFENYFQESINHLQRSAEVLLQLYDHNVLYTIYKLIGNIHEFLGNHSKTLEFYYSSLDMAVASKQLEKEIKIELRIIQKQAELGLHEKNVESINDLLQKIEDKAFIDYYTLVYLHHQLADSLTAVGKKGEALEELIKADDMLKTFHIPLYEQVVILEKIMHLSSELNPDIMEPYIQELADLSSRLEASTIKQPKIYRPMGELKELWIFHSIAGIKIYSYAPDTDVDHDLLGGFLTALQQFSLQISQKEFDSLMIGKDRFLIYQEEGYNYYFLGRSEAKSSEDTVRKIMAILYARFWKEYSQTMKVFGGDITPFRTFTKIIESLDLTLID